MKVFEFNGRWVQGWRAHLALAITWALTVPGSLFGPLGALVHTVLLTVLVKVLV